jgi:hypothetical protein
MRIIAEVCAFAKKVNAKEFDIPQCFVAAIKRGRLCLDVGTTEEILSQVIIPSKEMPKGICLWFMSYILQFFIHVSGRDVDTTLYPPRPINPTLTPLDS